MSKKPTGKPRKKRTKLLALEPRMLFDGALAVDLAAQASTAQPADGHVADAGVSDAKPAPTAPQEATPSAAPVQSEAASLFAPGRELRSAPTPACRSA